ncbi:glutamyl-Q tRNA(Asp) synthetase [Alteromonadaceae bacterium Bs31]|nr:glutamyl-Q tRNA(Asp) synthetase [Alteromonadaceae bacterium Bs31]
MTKAAPRYVGRFAPSPSGPLHMGSLVCALASYLDARSSNGRWLLRIEDIDPPREQAGATAEILKCLESHGLHWDDQPLYQSERSHAYRDALTQLGNANLSYSCNCNRARIKAIGGTYDKHCYHQPPPKTAATATRFDMDRALEALKVPAAYQFLDGIQGAQVQDLRSQGDFVIHRRDGLFAYQLAVVVDDIFQGITQVVRGADLLPMTAQQCILFQCFGYTAPHYHHHRLITDAEGNKLSKQNHAAAINKHRHEANLIQAISLLSLAESHQHRKELEACDSKDLLSWAVQQWNVENQPSDSSVLLE